MSTLATAPVRRLSAADLGACQVLAADRGWGRETGKWRFLFDVSDVFGIDDPAGGLAGAVVVTRYAPVDGGAGVAAIGMLLVASRHGRRGLGTRLMRHAIDHAGRALVSLYSTEEGRPLYDRLGFRPASGVVTYEGDYEADAAASADVRIRHAIAADLAAVASRDRDIFGADRGALIAKLPDFAERVLVADCGDGITGYGAAWRNEGRLYVGPLSADGDATARALIDALLRDVDGPTRVDLTDDSAHLGSWVAARGLRPRPRIPLLVYGDGEPPGARRSLYSPLMQAVG